MYVETVCFVLVHLFVVCLVFLEQTKMSQCQTSTPNQIWHWYYTNAVSWLKDKWWERLLDYILWKVHFINLTSFCQYAWNYTFSHRNSILRIHRSFLMYMIATAGYYYVFTLSSLLWFVCIVEKESYSSNTKKNVIIALFITPASISYSCDALVTVLCNPVYCCLCLLFFFQ